MNQQKKVSFIICHVCQMCKRISSHKCMHMSMSTTTSFRAKHPIIYLSSDIDMPPSLTNNVNNVMLRHTSLHDSTHLVEQGQWWRLQSVHCCACRCAASRRSDTCTLIESSCTLSALPLNKCSWLTHCSTDWAGRQQHVVPGVQHTSACTAQVGAN